MNEGMIFIHNISFAYEKNQVYDNFSLCISQNDIFFIMGINGCGKTTLLKLVCNFLKTDSGEIIVSGKSVNKYGSKCYSRVVAYVPQTIKLNSDFLVKDYLVMGRNPYKSICSSINKNDYAIVEKYAEKLGIASLLDVNFNTLSGGQKQIVAICRALVQETPIIVMDEPMSALDLGKQADFLSLLLELKRQGKTIVLTSHNPNHALAISEHCTVGLLHNKELVGIGKCSDVLSQNNVTKVFGDKIQVKETYHSIVFNIDPGLLTY